MYPSKVRLGRLFPASDPFPVGNPEQIIEGFGLKQTEGAGVAQWVKCPTESQAPY